MSEKGVLFKYGAGGILLMIMFGSAYMFVLQLIGIVEEVLISFFYLAGMVIPYYLQAHHQR